MKRREFIAVLGGAAVCPLAGNAQQPERMRRVGVLMSLPENDPISQARVTIVAQALGRFGWVEGKNIQFDYRFAASDPTLFKTYAAELVGLAPDAILATSPSAVAALRQQTRTIPVVFTPVADPVGQGFVQSLSRPGGNLTGFSSYGAELMGKWIQLLKEVAPSVTRVAVIFNPDTAPLAPLYNGAIEAAARRSREISAAGSGTECGADSGIGRSADPAARPPLPLRQLRSIEGEMPSSLAIWLNGRPLLTSRAIASRLSSSVK